MSLTWNETLSVNVPTIDDDHRMLVRIINDLYEAVQAGCAPRILGRILGRLADYAGGHFAREEQVMRHYAFPGLQDHIHQHDALINRLSGIVYEFENAETAVTVHTIDLMRDWFEQHLGREDAVFGSYLRDRFAGGSMETSAVTVRRTRVRAA